MYNMLNKSDNQNLTSQQNTVHFMV